MRYLYVGINYKIENLVIEILVPQRSKYLNNFKVQTQNCFKLFENSLIEFYLFLYSRNFAVFNFNELSYTNYVYES